MGTAVRARSLVRAGCWLAGTMALFSPGPVEAAERHVVVVAGVPGSDEHAARQEAWVEQFVATLRGPLGLPEERLVVLRGNASDPDRRSTRENVERVFARLADTVGPDALVVVLLIGHGTYDGIDAKFNLPGPDLEAGEWARLAQRVPAPLVFVNTASASAPFLARLAGPRRIVITATDSPVQRYDTVFPQYFVAAFADPEADLDKDERVSIWEAFAFASLRVKRHYEQRGQLATERAVLDDTGDGVGKVAGDPGPDGAIASRTFLDAGPDPVPGGGAARSELLARRERLLEDLADLKRRESFMPPADYARELERLLLEIARISREIRRQS